MVATTSGRCQRSLGLPASGGSVPSAPALGLQRPSGAGGGRLRAAQGRAAEPLPGGAGGRAPARRSLPRAGRACQAGGLPPPAVAADSPLVGPCLLARCNGDLRLDLPGRPLRGSSRLLLQAAPGGGPAAVADPPGAPAAGAVAGGLPRRRLQPGAPHGGGQVSRGGGLGRAACRGGADRGRADAAALRGGAAGRLGPVRGGGRHLRGRARSARAGAADTTHQRHLRGLHGGTLRAHEHPHGGRGPAPLPRPGAAPRPHRCGVRGAHGALR
mmetsp:Transcript_75168/g.237600  ORF Transcript_75168/g.237600 Transcript_75168/m.237600 type:complete len:271 (-) Transcript_75168:425-1237(-)